ncbi:ATP-binding cassette sub-family A member 3, partial [Elysia marginata]
PRKHDNHKGWDANIRRKRNYSRSVLSSKGSSSFRFNEGSPNSMEAASPDSGPPVLLREVTKFSTDRRSKAIRTVSLKVSTGRCFGVLGARGAGKSTLLRIIVGLEQPEAGVVKVLPNRAQDKGGLSFCLPSCQLMPELTVRETLQLIGWLRGVSPNQMHEDIDHLLDLFALTQKSETFCAALNKKEMFKTRLVAALIGDPLLIVLDLPGQNLTLLDIKVLGDLLGKLRSSGSTVVLATEMPHVCEALCTDIGIMRQGLLTRVREVSSYLDCTALGSKFCQGYLVHMIFNEGEHKNHQQFFVEAVERIDGVEVFTDEKGNATFHFLGRNVNLAKVFVLMEDGRLHYGVGEYTVVQADVGFILANAFASQEPCFTSISSFPGQVERRVLRSLNYRTRSSLVSLSTSID